MVIDALRPTIDGGRHPIKRVLGDRVAVEADLLVDGHDYLAGVLRFRRRGASEWQETPLAPASDGPPSARSGRPVNDRWLGTFVVDALGTWEYTVSAWVDTFTSWRWAIGRKLEASQDVAVDLLVGAALVGAAAERAPPGTAMRAELREQAHRLAATGESGQITLVERAALALSPELAALMEASPDRAAETTHTPARRVQVEPALAGFSGWYEMFPRSCGSDGRHGTLRDAERRLPDIADMGFDIVYLPPIHPIGRTHRKGPDNRPTAAPGDPGSPWAIGAPEGGHLAVHPELGTLEDFRHFVAAAREHGLSVALDIALQVSPDHPYVQQHPEWFVHRPDGTIQYGENPPKKYEDIYPFDFAGPAWRTLWHEARGIFRHWIAQGVKVFRVDNPHTKPLPFWEWCIRTIQERHPEVIFLAEAFTRPKLMYGLAKLGFSQSYTYFTWRTTKGELTDYIRSMVDSEVVEFFRPSFWPNTPDILPDHLQFGTRATFIARAVLAATLSPSWGVYGPAYELQEKVARDGSEEYAWNEKYQLRSWDLARPDSLRPVLRRLNQIRRSSPALRRLTGTVFHPTDNDALLCYSRGGGGGDGGDGGDDGDSNGDWGPLLVVVNLDPRQPQAGWLALDLAALGLAAEARFQVHDLIGDSRYLWQGARAFVSLDPGVMPAHIFRVRRYVHTEHTFDYYL